MFKLASGWIAIARRQKFRRSLRIRLIVLLFLVSGASGVAAYLMIELFRISVSAQIDRAEAVAARACGNISERYRFYVGGWEGPRDLSAVSLRRDLRAVVELALRDRSGVEGGIWQSEAGSLAYAYPTYEGGGSKTDIPQAEITRIESVNRTAARDDTGADLRYAGRSQTLLIHACLLPGPIQGLTAWTMTRVFTAAWDNYGRVREGLAILLACAASASVLLVQLLLTWSRHVGGIEGALSSGSSDLTPLALTGEVELDRIIVALNRAGERLAAAGRHSANLSRRIATAERLASIGRMTAAFAHEVRNPIAAMRLKAENALAAAKNGSPEVLIAIVGQIDRLDRLIQQLLSASQKELSQPSAVAMRPFIEEIVMLHRETAEALSLRIAVKIDVQMAILDPVLTKRALDNLISNALKHAPPSSVVCVAVHQSLSELLLDVTDRGSGVDPALADKIFEPFVSGRPDGSGLGLAIATEAIATQGGTLRFLESATGAHFQIALPATS